MYVITGATGNIGSKITGLLLARGEQVRVIGRNSAKMKTLVEKGAEPAIGNLKDTPFISRAFTGATAVFAMIPPDYSARDFRAYQNDVGASIASAIRNAGVQYVVNLSSQGAELSSGTGPILGLRDQEARLNRLDGHNILHLRPTYFMENLLVNIPLIARQGIAGSAIRGDLKFSMIATSDIASKAADLLTNRNFTGKPVRDLLGQRDLSLAEAIETIGRQLSMPDLKYKQFSYEDAARGMREMGISADVSRLLIEMSRALNNGLFAVGKRRTLQNTTPTTIEEFARIFAEEFWEATHQKAA